MKDEDLIILGIFSAVVMAWTILNAFFCLTLMRCLQRIQPRNREMEPGLVWLNLVPCVGTIWIFFIVTRLTASLKKEYRWRRWRTRGEGFGGGVGTAHATLNLVAKIPVICSTPFAIASLICLIIYWVQIANYSSRLLEPYDNPLDDGFDELDHDYEQRRLPRDHDDDEYPRDRLDDRIRRERRDAGDDEPDDRIRAGG